MYIIKVNLFIIHSSENTYKFMIINRKDRYYFFFIDTIRLRSRELCTRTEPNSGNTGQAMYQAIRDRPIHLRTETIPMSMRVEC